MNIDRSTYIGASIPLIDDINKMTVGQIDDVLHKAWIIIGELGVKPIDDHYEDAVADPVQEMSKEDVALSNKTADIQLCQYHITYCRDYMMQL